MDLPPLRPSASGLSSTVRILRSISRFGTRLRIWFVASAFVLANEDPSWTDVPRLLICLRDFSSYSLRSPFVVLFRAKLPKNLDKSLSCHFVALNCSGWHSAIRPLSCQSLMTMFVDFALWPAFCSGSWYSKSKPAPGARLEIGFRKGDPWVIPPVQSVC